MPQLLRFPYIIARISIIIFLPHAFNSCFLYAGPHTSVPAHRQSSSEKDAEIARLSVQLRTADPEGRRDAAISLSHFRNGAATSALIAALADSSSPVRAAAVTSLGDIGDSSAVAALAATLASDKQDFVRKAAAYALGRLSGSESTKALVAALKDKEPEIRGAAVVSLGEHADATTVPPLSSALSDKSSFVRAHAAAALGAIGPASASAVPTLIGLMKSDADAEVKRQIAAALGAIGDRSALPALHSAAADSDPFLAEAARESIKKLNR